MTPKGRIYAAVLEERSVNPMLAGKNPTLARSAPYSVYKTAQYNEAVSTLNKIANMTNASMTNTAMQNPNRMHGGLTPNMTNVDDRVGGGLGGAFGGGALGTVGGILGGSRGKTLSLARMGKGALIGGSLGAVAGGIYGASKKVVKPQTSI